MSCGKAIREDLLLRKPDIFDLRYKYSKGLKLHGRGLKLKLVKGPLSKEKMLCGPQFNEKKLTRATKYYKSSENKLNLIKN
jgi:hypothetical protein